ncbi:MAG: radical SAM protein [Deltaproteobacteria bacterium]|nr:radical SAM protein [Deltaproteobacteria bacterium]
MPPATATRAQRHGAPSIYRIQPPTLKSSGAITHFARRKRSTRRSSARRRSSTTPSATSVCRGSFDIAFQDSAADGIVSIGSCSGRARAPGGDCRSHGSKGVRAEWGPTGSATAVPSEFSALARRRPGRCPGIRRGCRAPGHCGSEDAARRARRRLPVVKVAEGEESVGFGQKREQHEHAAHQVRNWVRLTFDCNDRCVFCLDSDTHDGRIRARDEVKAQILDGRRKGAERLILSGGEPTIHPDFVDFVRLGRAAGYTRVQTVTNGRMFAYPEFLRRALDAGLGEITFSIHGPDAKIHDALVGVKGAFDEEIAGLRAALADGRPVVNIDVCVNRANVRHLPRMLRTFMAMGVREFDLLQVIPFGRAWREGETTLFYDLEAHQDALRETFAMSREPDVHLWLNRFPVEHLEGFESLIQDPYKLNDEVRGRREEYERLLADGTPLPCREPARCRHCYVRRLCDHLDDTREALAAQRFDVVRFDLDWEAALPPSFGGDPASAERSRARAAAADHLRRLPVVDTAVAEAPPGLDLAARIAASGATRAWIVAADLAAARGHARTLPRALALELELRSTAGLAAALAADGSIDGRSLDRVRTRELAQTEAVLAIAGSFEVLAPFDREHAAWLATQTSWPSRLALVQPNYELASDAATRDAPLTSARELVARFGAITFEGVPHCRSGIAPRAPARVLDTAMLASTALDGAGASRLEIFRYTRRFVHDHDHVKSLRCRTCVHDPSCRGATVNFVRAHGFAALVPEVRDTPSGD